MSNVIKDSKGEFVHTNMNGCYIAVDDKYYKYSEILPVILHYICGGLFGHAVVNEKSSKVIYLSSKELSAIEKFISQVKSLKKTNTSSGNISFVSEQTITPKIKKNKKKS